LVVRVARGLDEVQLGQMWVRVLEAHDGSACSQEESARLFEDLGDPERAAVATARAVAARAAHARTVVLRDKWAAGRRGIAADVLSTDGWRPPVLAE
jgi:hypothetical protein